MTPDDRTLRPACEPMRERIQRRLDGRGAVERDEPLELHLAACPECASFHEELESIQLALQSMPLLRMPDETLDAVWARTTHAASASTKRYGAPLWLGVAAVLTLALVGLWLARVPPVAPLAVATHERVSEEEQNLDAAKEDLRFVLELTSSVLDRTRRAGREVLAEEISPTVRRVPLRLPGVSSRTERRAEI